MKLLGMLVVLVLAGCLSTKATYNSPKGGTVSIERTAFGLNIQGIDASVVVPCNGSVEPTGPNNTPDSAMCPVFTVHEAVIDSTTALSNALGASAHAVDVLAAKVAVPKP